LRKLILATAILGASIYPGTASASDPITTPAPLSQEGCVSQPTDTCTYTATRTGGYVARGDTWSLSVSFPAPAPVPPATCGAGDIDCDGKLTWTYGPSNAPPQGCSLWEIGATVTISAGASGGIAAGNPFPGAADGQVNNECAGGRLPNRTDATPR